VPLSLDIPPIVLASASPRRREILDGAGIRFTAVPADIDESMPGISDPLDYVQKVALAKARAVARTMGDDGSLLGRTVLGADTCVTLGGIIYGKPKSTTDAVRILRALSGRTHLVVTGVAFVSTQGIKTFEQETLVTFYPLDDALIDAYVATGETMDKAGAYGIQGMGALLVSHITGDYLNVVGLPLARLVRELVGFDRQPLGQERA
jgi:septum formation protein